MNPAGRPSLLQPASSMITEQDILEHAMRQARRAFWTKVLVVVATAGLLVYVALR